MIKAKLRWIDKCKLACEVLPHEWIKWQCKAKTSTLSGQTTSSIIRELPICSPWADNATSFLPRAFSLSGTAQILQGQLHTTLLCNTNALTIQLAQQQSIEHIHFLGKYISNDAIVMIFFKSTISNQGMAGEKARHQLRSILITDGWWITEGFLMFQWEVLRP